MKEVQSRELKLSEVMEYIGEYFRRNDFVIVPRATAEAEKLKERYLRKRSLTYKEIADSNIWGEIGKQAVIDRVAKYLKRGIIFSHEIDKSGHTHRIRRQAFERIAKISGTI